ncbi:Plasmodium exported protein (Pm-fam-a like), unknown function [Plasmodium malariae]|uniref:Fam-l protein n=1 Tax=Plasmodium malariae TaxID=5858 RepID=A0A1A8X385_PLAMA|nr:Plasmodium exported protein (Pm-fam-a like), unknown function [Plasmodium malariae]
MKLWFLIEITAFDLLTWRINLLNDMSSFKKYFDENYDVLRKLDTRIYRLLTKNKQNSHLSTMSLKEEVPYNGENKREHTYINEKRELTRKKLLNVSSLNNCKNHKQEKKIKSFIFETKKFSYLEKNIFKELDYENFLKNNRVISDKLYKEIMFKKYRLRIVLKNNRVISDKLYKEIMFKKYRLRIALPLLLFLSLSLSLILDLFVGCGLINMLRQLLSMYDKNIWKFLGQNFGNFIGKDLADFLRPLWTYTTSESGQIKMKVYATNGLCGILIYFLPFVILGVTLISGIIYYHKKVKKFEKIKLRKR